MLWLAVGEPHWYDLPTMQLLAVLSNCRLDPLIGANIAARMGGNLAGFNDTAVSNEKTYLLFWREVPSPAVDILYFHSLCFNTFICNSMRISNDIWGFYFSLTERELRLHFKLKFRCKILKLESLVSLRFSTLFNH